MTFPDEEILASCCCLVFLCLSNTAFPLFDHSTARLKPSATSQSGFAHYSTNHTIPHSPSRYFSKTQPHKLLALFISILRSWWQCWMIQRPRSTSHPRRQNSRHTGTILTRFLTRVSDPFYYACPPMLFDDLLLSLTHRGAYLKIDANHDSLLGVRYRHTTMDSQGNIA